MQSDAISNKHLVQSTGAASSVTSPSLSSGVELDRDGIADAYSRRGIEQYKRHEPGPSLDAFSQLAKLRQLSAGELRFVGLDYVALGDLPSAEKWLRVASKMDPGQWRTWRYLGGVQFSEEHVADAEYSFRECLKIEPNDALAEDGLARSLEAEGRLTDAMTSYYVSLRLNASNGTASYLPPLHIGGSLLRQGEAAKAVPYLRDAERLNSQDSETHELLGQAYALLGNADDAIRETEEASALCPQRARLHYLLARLYFRLHRPVDGRAELNKYQRLRAEFPDDPDR